MKVEVVDFRPEWAQLYRKEAEKVRSVLKDILIEIYHIGSTAVPGLQAKPIIDIMPVVTKIELTDRHSGAFEQLGYEYMGEFGIPGRRYLRKGGEQRTHQIHIFEEANQADILRHLAVRDFLRTHPDQARVYGTLKKSLAAQFPNDIEGYCDGKDAFMKHLEQTALAWYNREKTKKGNAR